MKVLETQRSVLSAQIDVIVEDLDEEKGHLQRGDKSREPDRPSFILKENHVEEPDPCARDLDQEHQDRKVSRSLGAGRVIRQLIDQMVKWLSAISKRNGKQEQSKKERKKEETLILYVSKI